MHMEPGIVDGSKLVLSYVTSGAALGVVAYWSYQAMARDGVLSWLLRAMLATVLVFGFFEVLPHHPVGISEVHLILGSTLLLLLGPAATAVGLAGGLLAQGLFFAPFDLPQYGMNVTTLLVPLMATASLARRVVPEGTASVDLRYAQAFKLSLAYQGGIVAWVAFWAFFGQGIGADNLVSVMSFGAAYMTVLVVEPLVDLAVLAAAKHWPGLRNSRWLQPRVFQAA